MSRNCIASLLLVVACAGCRMCSSCCDYCPPVVNSPYDVSHSRAGSVHNSTTYLGATYEEAITPTPQELLVEEEPPQIQQPDSVQ